MKRLVIPLVILFAAVFSVTAHNSKIATITLRDTGAGWIAELNFAQASVDAAMEHHLGKGELKDISRDAYRDEVVAYVKSNFHLQVDGQEILLENGGIMLGSHQTDLKFVLPGIPQQPENMKVYVPMFGTSYNHTNLFRIYRGGDKMTKFFLSEDNDFRVNLNFEGNRIEAIETTNNGKRYSLAKISGVLIVIIGGIGLLSVLKRKKSEVMG